MPKKQQKKFQQTKGLIITFQEREYLKLKFIYRHEPLELDR